MNLAQLIDPEAVQDGRFSKRRARRLLVPTPAEVDIKMRPAVIPASGVTREILEVMASDGGWLSAAEILRRLKRLDGYAVNNVHGLMSNIVERGDADRQRTDFNATFRITEQGRGACDESRNRSSDGRA